MSNSVERGATKSNREFIGRAWLNETRNGKSFINIKLDRDIKTVSLAPSMRIELWPNTKREGKKDADYRLSIVDNVPAQAAA